MAGPGRFVKGQALGNDYLVLESGALPGRLDAAAVRMLCERHTGVGADGVIEVLAPEEQAEHTPATPTAAIEVVVWNADGTTAEVSGNGLRIASLALARTGAGVWSTTLTSRGRSYRIARRADGLLEVTLPPARIEQVAEAVEVLGRRVRLTAVDVGNPHAVLDAGEVTPADWPALAAALERHPRFPAHVNVERVERVTHGADMDARDRATLAVQIHERGVGPTAASGTGAAAAAAAALALGLVVGPIVEVRMAGGTVEVRSGPDAIVLAGPVALSFEGTLSAVLLDRIERMVRMARPAG